jgi:hypothetical protein
VLGSVIGMEWIRRRFTKRRNKRKKGEGKAKEGEGEKRESLEEMALI